MSDLQRSEFQSVHFRLKSGTENLHREAEQSPIMGRLFAADFEKNDYSQYLLRMYLFLKPIEFHLSAFFPSPTLPDFPQRLKTVALATDLSTLGVQGLNQLSTCAALPEIRDEVDAFGVMYVIEGSCLGGAVIRDRLSRYNFFSKEEFNFLNIYGENLGKNWRTFLTALDRKAAESPENPERMVKAAQETFKKIIDWMSPAPVGADTAREKTLAFR